MEKVIQRLAWSPGSYKNFKQYINYFSHDHPVFEKLNRQSPIVSIQKIEEGKKLIAQCENNRSAFLHIGDCAEPFQHAEQQIMQKKIQFLRECKNVLSGKNGKPTLLIGRIAGQYAKPRSSQFVMINGVKTHNYKGDNINGLHENDRNPCQIKLMKGYENSINSARLIESRFPDLFVSHEGLVLPYEESFTKQYDNKYYCQSAHMIWIGERTRQLDGAHVQFFRGIQNPIGVKVSSNITQKQFIRLVTTLNPKNEKGKLLVIVRMGYEKIKSKLSSLINIKDNQGLNFLFVTDPMHANTFDSKQSKLKTRNIAHILQQASKSTINNIEYFEQRLQDKKIPYGYSLQSTFEDVTECFGLTYPIKQSEIQISKYQSKCDPRLNRQQTFKLLSMLDT